ncbi:hypothetical protein HMI56_004823, partial [Coelomomyces lativittatus]
FFVNANDPCSVNTKPTICNSTLSSRADSLQADLDNREVCLVPPEAKTKGQQFINSLRSFPWASQNAADSHCISGELNENNANSYRKCGWYSELTACKNEKTCLNMDKSLSSKCPTILANQSSTPTTNTTPDSTNASLIVSISVGVLALVCLLIGLRSLSSIRTNSEDKKNELPPPTPMKDTKLPLTPPPSSQPELFTISSFQEPSVIRPISLVETPRSSMVNSYYKTSPTSSVLFSQPPLTQSQEIFSPTPVSPFILPQSLPNIPKSSPPLNPLPSIIAPPEASPPSISPQSPQLLHELRQPHINSFSPLSIPSPTASIAVFAPSLSNPSNSGILPSKSDPKKRPPNSRANLQPVLSPILATPVDESKGYF